MSLSFWFYVQIKMTVSLTIVNPINSLAKKLSFRCSIHKCIVGTQVVIVCIRNQTVLTIQHIPS